MAFEARVLQGADVSAAMDLVRRVFMEFEAPDYSEEGVQEFCDYIEPVQMTARQQKGEVILWGCFEKAGALTGVLAMAPLGHVSLLFVDAQHHRRGMARAMFRQMVQRCEGKCKEITVNSSPYAFEAYKKLGFEATGPEQTVNGLRFIPMVFCCP